MVALVWRYRLTTVWVVAGVTVSVYLKVVL